MPVICHDACGMAEIIDETCGIKVAMVNPTESTRGYVAALHQLLGDPTLVERLSVGARERAKALRWDKKLAIITEAYRKAVGESESQVREMSPATK
jgi:glycosyltransferase involved in cell wall biosynthesis